MNKPTYSDKLKNPLWQKKRLEIFNRDNFSCQCCKETTKELQVHHIEYIPGIMPWEYSNDMLKTLCVDCHRKEQGREELESHLATSLRMHGFLYTDLLAFSCLIDINQDFREYLIKLLKDFQGDHAHILDIGFKRRRRA
jgi:hypothetical protein